MNSLWVASYIALWIVVAGLAIIIVGLLRQLGLIQLRLGLDPGVLMTPEGLQRGAEAPDFEAIDVHTNDGVRLSAFRGRRVILVFLTSTCSACSALVPHLNDFAREQQGAVEILVICYGNESTCREFARQVKLRPIVLADPSNAIAVRYGVNFSPFAFLINEAGTILIRGVVNTGDQLDALLKEEGTFQGKRPWRPVIQGDMVSAAGEGNGTAPGKIDLSSSVTSSGGWKENTRG